MTMIERVAKRLQKAHFERGRGLWPGWPDDRFEREMWLYSARTALEELREPTEGMVEAGRAAFRRGGLMPTYTDMLTYLLRTEVWPSMIDDVLREKDGA